MLTGHWNKMKLLGKSSTIYPADKMLDNIRNVTINIIEDMKKNEHPSPTLHIHKETKTI